jgi:pentatricopeptide repeat protein
VEVIDYWCRKGKEDKAREALKEMNDLGVRPNLQAYTAILALSVEYGHLTISVWPAFGLVLTTLRCCLLYLLCRKGNLERASIIFKEIKSVGLIPSPTCYNYMIDLCIKNAQQDRINNLLTEMQQMNIPPDSNTFVLFLKARDLETTKRVRVQMSCHPCRFRPNLLIALLGFVVR